MLVSITPALSGRGYYLVNRGNIMYMSNFNKLYMDIGVEII